MSEIPPACFDPIPELVLENWDGVSDAVRRAALEKAVKSHQALSALGDPVVVAEALPELVEAAKGIECLMAREGENSLEHFERIAEMFYRDTRMLMPGKDAGLLPGPTEEDRLEAYEAWREKPANRLRSVLAKLKARP